MALDGLDADEERARDLLRRVRLGDQLEHLELARRQHVELLLAPTAALDVVAHERGHGGGIEKRVAPHGGANGVDDVGVGAGLQHVAGRAGLQCLEQELLAVVHRQHQDLELGLALLQLGGGLDAGHARHRDVEDDEVDVLLERLLDGLVAVVGLGHDLEVGLASRTFRSPERTIGWSSAIRIRVTSGIGIRLHAGVSTRAAGTSRRTSTPPSAPA